MTGTCDGALTRLAGELVLFTGTSTVNGDHMVRDTLWKHTLRLGGQVAKDRSRKVTVLVHGDLWGRKVADAKRGYSQKLVFVEETMRRFGLHIHVIDDMGFENLLHGRPARCFSLRRRDEEVVAE